jgi:hypothetical protein
MGERIMAWIIRLVSGWFPTSGEKTGKLIWVVGIVLMVLLATNLYERLMDKLFPKQPNVINVSGDYIQEQKDLLNFGCSAWRGYIRLGIKSR